MKKSDTHIVSEGSYGFSKENTLSLHWALLPSRIYLHSRGEILCSPAIKTPMHVLTNTQHIKERVRRRGFLELNLSKKTSKSALSFLLQILQDEKVEQSRLGMDTEYQSQL